MAGVYLDSSAVVKLVIEEPESSALRRYLRRRRPIVASALIRTEVVRAVLLEDEAVRARAEQVVAKIDQIRLNNRILDAAAALQPPLLRSLDAIHLATAIEVAATVVVTYDDRLRVAVDAHRLRTAAPA